jgi:UDP-N-acetylglucosamine diphosphorylase/glucosamine-1-phosphate N-acetyltransferase
MIEHLKKIISSDLIINDKVYNFDDTLQFPWQWITNIDLFFKDIESSYSRIDNVIIDESNGPVFISESAIIEPFVIINGPVFIGDNCLIKSHSNISKSIINHDCKIKGEVHTSIFQPFANKAHEGFLGHSFIASWVNLGAGTTTSNLKNNYSNVSVKWNGELVDTKSIFFGSIIGEHVKTSIGTNLNTGTVIEMGSNIVSQSFPPRYIPSFSFYYNGKISKITFEDFKDVASKAMSRRNVDFSSIEAALFDLYKKD